MSVQEYLQGTEVRLVIPLVDRDGNSLDASSISYIVSDETDAVVIAETPVTSYLAGQDVVTITIPAQYNTIDTMTNPGQYRGMRQVQVKAIVNDNTISLMSYYAIAMTETLIVGVNSFQTLVQAELTAMEIPNLFGWATAFEADKIAAMAEARTHIASLTFRSPFDLTSDPTNIDYVPAGVYPNLPGAGILVFSGDISYLNPQQLAALPPRFQKALRQAQVAEADDILAGANTVSKRADGLILETIGTVKKMYRNSKPVHMSVCSRARSYLARYINISLKTGRAT